MPSLMSDELRDQIYKVVREVLYAEFPLRQRGADTRNIFREQHWAQMQEDVDAPEDGITDPGFGDFEIMARDLTSTGGTGQELLGTGIVKELVHRNELKDLKKDQLIRVEDFDGEWGEYLGAHQPRHQGVLLSTLAAATDAISSPSTGTVHIMEANAAGTLVTTNRCVSVVHRFEYIAIDAGTLVRVEWVGNEWGVYSADCDNTMIATTACT